MNKVITFGLLLMGTSSFAALGGGDVANFIGDSHYTTNVFDLNARAGLQGAPAVQPWSGTFWPLRSGSTGNAYAERAKGDLIFKWNQLLGAKANLRKFERRMSDLREKISSGRLDAATIRDMAPSEKYDLYIGDSDFTYTQAEWQSVSEQLNYIGKISLWEGSCHGWSTAAIYEARPEHLFSVMSLDGKYLIPFYPDDLKALATRLWANSLIQDYTVAQGLRCTSKHPVLDAASGKVLDPTCQGVNPGDFHISMLEMVGGRKQSFVVNRSNTRQVWNQPVAGYELNYFNPITEKDGDLASSVVSREAYADPFKKFRDDSVKSIVGVEMTLRYIKETSPNHDDTDDTTARDRIKDMKIRYDLELDQYNQIVGGEWRGKNDPVASDDTSSGDGYDDETTGSIPKFPGFLWKFKSANPVAMSVADFDFPETDPSKAAPAALIAASKKAAQFRYNHYIFVNNVSTGQIKRSELKPQPLGKVVNSLINMAK